MLYKSFIPFNSLPKNPIILPAQITGIRVKNTFSLINSFPSKKYLKMSEDIDLIYMMIVNIICTIIKNLSPTFLLADD